MTDNSLAKDANQDGPRGLAGAVRQDVPAQWRRLGSLQALRGLAALWVVIYHVDVERFIVGGPLYPVPGARFGWLGVDLFFVLSAYVLAPPFLEGRAPRFARFLTDRFLRIAPAYYASWIVTVLLILVLFPGVFSPGPASLSLVFAQNMHWRGYYAVNPVFWTLAVEMQFYLLLPLLARLFAGRRWMLALVGCIAITTAWRYLLWPDQAERFVATFGLPGFLTHFGLGIAAARLRTIRAPGLAFLAAIPLVFAPVFLWIPQNSISFGYETHVGQILVRQVPALGFMLVVLSAASGGLLERTLRWRPLRGLGDMSYSLYLIHFPVMRALPRLPIVGTALDPATQPWTFAAAAVVFSLLGGYALYRVVERPAERWRQARKRRLAAAQAAAGAPGGRESSGA